MIRGFFPRALIALLLLCSGAFNVTAADSLVSGSDYDAHLCRTAQRAIVNAGPEDFRVTEQIGDGNGFHVIQMDIDVTGRAVSIAMTTEFTTLNGRQSPAWVACKMVDRDRVNDMLGLQLPAPGRQCRAVNELTYQRSLATLSATQRERFLTAGRPLRFADDAIIQTGGEWLPIRMDGFVASADDGGIVIRAPSVRVPWNRAERQFYQGTQHCKLITLATMHHWMTSGAFDPQAQLLPASELDCRTPHSMTSAVGSCLFYFGPARAMFCQDYSGADWSAASAQQECSQRHASEVALRKSENRYAGAGGTFSTDSCEIRSDTPDLNGTCVFNCRQPDETLWHISGPADPRMTRGCDLFVPNAAALP